MSPSPGSKDRGIGSIQRNPCVRELRIMSVGLRRLTGSPLASCARGGKITLMRQRDFQHHTYADYLVWSAESGNELIDGVAYVREPPSPSALHQEFVLELALQIRNARLGKWHRGYIAPLDVRLPKAGSADDQIDTVVHRCLHRPRPAKDRRPRDVRRPRLGRRGPLTLYGQIRPND